MQACSGTWLRLGDHSARQNIIPIAAQNGRYALSGFETQAWCVEQAVFARLQLIQLHDGHASLTGYNKCVKPMLDAQLAQNTPTAVICQSALLSNKLLHGFIGLEQLTLDVPCTHLFEYSWITRPEGHFHGLRLFFRK